MDTRRCASKDAGLRRVWIGGSHIDWGRERVLARKLGPEGGWIVRSHIGWEENETFFIRVWKHSLLLLSPVLMLLLVSYFRMEFAFRTWVREKREGLNSDDLDELRREVQTALGTAKWQVGY